MARRYPCPTCRREMLLEKAHEGFEVPCPACGQRFLVPAGATDTPPPVPAAVDRTIPPPRRPSGDANDGLVAMILGILGLTATCGLTSPFAWYLGHQARQQAIRAGREPPGYATAGWILGIVGSCTLVLSGCFVIGWFALMAASFSL